MNTGQLVKTLRDGLTATLQLGEKVKHPIYGEGMVSFVYSDNLVEVTFGETVILPMRATELTRVEAL